MLNVTPLTVTEPTTGAATLRSSRCPEFCEGLIRDAALCLEQDSRRDGEVDIQNLAFGNGNH